MGRYHPFYFWNTSRMIRNSNLKNECCGVIIVIGVLAIIGTLGLIGFNVITDNPITFICGIIILVVLVYFIYDKYFKNDSEDDDPKD